MLQNLCSDHLPILLTVPLSSVFRPNERLPSLNFRKARQDNFAFYFDSYCPSVEEYSSLFLPFAAVRFTSLTLNALIIPFTSISVRNCFLSSPVLSGYNGSPDTRFFRTTTRLMNWPDEERYLRPQQSLVVTLLLSLVFTLVFSRTGGVLPHLNSSTHWFLRFPPSNLCFYVMFAVFPLAFAAMDTAFFKLLSI